MTPIIWYVVISCTITGLISLYSAYETKKILYIFGSYIIIGNAITSGLWDLAIAGVVFLAASSGNLTLNISPVIAWVPVLYTIYRVMNVWRDLFFAGQANDTWVRNAIAWVKKKIKELWLW